jgi:uncharacterized membrane protein YdjX (TVP38/TMEM64 family)
MTEEPVQKAWRFPLKWAGFAVLLIGLFAAVRLLPVNQWLEAFNEWVSNLGPWGIVIFIGAYVLATIMLVPGSMLTVGAGFVFGLGCGLFAVSIGSTIGAAFAFFISRFVAREKIEVIAKGNEDFLRIESHRGAGRKAHSVAPSQPAHPIQPE